MDLLNVISGLMTSTSSINALSSKTGTDSAQTKGILSTALPMLLSALTSNASSAEGAASLLGALQQHTNTASMEDQIANADAEDGGKIIQHILGSNQSSVIQSISEKTGADSKQVSSLLSNIAPGLMSGLSAATSAATRQAAKAKESTPEKKVLTAKPKLASAKAEEAPEKKLMTAKPKLASAKAEEAESTPEKKKMQATPKVAAHAAIEKEEEKPAEAASAAGLDLSGLMGLLGGGESKTESGGLGSLLGGLFGGAESGEKEDAANPLLGALSSLFK